LREICSSLQRAASGEIPAGAVRTKYVRRVRAAGNAALPTLLRALTAGTETEAAWAAYLLSRLRSDRVADRVSALVEDARSSPTARARALALLSDLQVEPSPARTTPNDSVSALEESIGALVGRLEEPEDLDEAVALVVSQIPERELTAVAAELARHRDPRARALIERLAVQITLCTETRRALRGLLAVDPDEDLAGRRVRGRAFARNELDAALDQLEAGHADRARRTLERLLTRDPDRADTRSALGVCLLELDQPGDAITHLEAAAALEPEEALHLWNIASAMKSADRVGGCYLALRRYLDAADTGDGASERQAEARRFLRGYEQMLRHAHPDVSLADVLRGETLFADAHAALEEGRAEDAARGFEAVLAMVPRHYPSWANLGAALVELGRRGEAIGCLRRALEIEPSYAPAQKNLTQLEERD
jgi:tetratricopeptide (TPR) repeat protein